MQLGKKPAPKSPPLDLETPTGRCGEAAIAKEPRTLDDINILAEEKEDALEPGCGDR